MKLTVVHDEHDAYAGEIVATALVRSFTAAQVKRTTYADAAEPTLASVLVNPREAGAQFLKAALAGGGKALVLGQISPVLADLLGLQILGDPLPSKAAAEATVCEAEPWNESPAAVHYDGLHELAVLAPFRQRALCRFDFANEWNHLGHGWIRLDGGPWAIAQPVAAAGAQPLARLLCGKTEQTVYAAVRDTTAGAALWFNRPVGPVDSLEWRIVESFFCDYRDELITLPALAELPSGCDAGFTVRLDCDEAVASARELFQFYADCKVPLSLAIRTDQQFGPADLRLMNDVLAAGGSVVSHSVSHEPNWGGSYDRALAEAQQSSAWIEQHLPHAAPVRFAVSPFHQNPAYAVQALSDAGYEGFVGGIIANDPEYLLGRAGQAPFAEREMVSLSAQSMLHGDCFRRYGCSVQPYIDSFHNHRRAGSIFGYLDHPFSARYQYGWDDEPQRLRAHEQLLRALLANHNTWRPSLGEALRFLWERNRTSLSLENSRPVLSHSNEAAGRHLAYRWKGRLHHG